MKNEADIKSVYLMSSEFGLRFRKLMQKILMQGDQISRGRGREGGLAFLVEITNWEVGL